MALEIRPLTSNEVESAFRVRAQAFQLSSQQLDDYRASIRLDRTLGAFEAGQLIGITVVHQLGQFFGERPVPMGGVASVAVAPHRRGEGIVTRLLMATLAAMRERGEVISTLYPATGVPYRRMGWELAGYRIHRRVPLRSLAMLPSPAVDVRIRPAEEADFELLAAPYAKVATATNGFVYRDDRWWRRRLHSYLSGEEHHYLYVVEEDGEIEGYLAFRQLRATSSDEWVAIAVDELLAADRHGLLALWGLLASNRSMTTRVSYFAGAEEPLTLLLAEQDTETIGDLRWMTRLVEVAGAVAARGYRDDVDVTVHLEVADTQAPWNAGRHVLRVQDGKGALEPGGRGRVRLTVNAFASLYTGYASPQLLARLGLVDAASESDLAALSAVFSGPPPWMAEFF